MSDKYKFRTLEELQAAYPINSVFSARREIHKNIRHIYNDADLQTLRRYNDSVEVINECECICTKTVINANIVEGYIYDGEYWYPATIGHDGWEELNEYHNYKEKEIVYDNTEYWRFRDRNRII